MKRHRVRALLGKEFAELRRNPAIFLPVFATAAFTVALPFAVAIAIPAIAGDKLSDDEIFRKALQAAREYVPAMADLEAEAAAQAYVFQQFLLFLVLVPVAGAMSLAAYSVVGEKQGRTLEPLLATPITTAELLMAKVLGAMVPSVAIAAGSLVAYLAGIHALAAAGVFEVLLSIRTLLIVLVIGPLAALVALQMAVIVSSRANDPRSAQQIGALVILPLTGLAVAQLSGSLFLTLPVILSIAAGLLVAWLGLAAFGVALFERETILTRWK